MAGAKSIEHPHPAPHSPLRRHFPHHSRERKQHYLYGGPLGREASASPARFTLSKSKFASDVEVCEDSEQTSQHNLNSTDERRQNLPDTPTPVM